MPSSSSSPKTNTITKIKHASSTTIFSINTLSEGRRLLISKHSVPSSEKHATTNTTKQKLLHCEGKRILATCISSTTHSSSSSEIKVKTTTTTTTTNSQTDENDNEMKLPILLYFGAITTDGTFYLGRMSSLMKIESFDNNYNNTADEDWFSPRWIGKYSGLVVSSGDCDDQNQHHQQTANRMNSSDIGLASLADLARDEQIEQERQNSFFLKHGNILPNNFILASPIINSNTTHNSTNRNNQQSSPNLINNNNKDKETDTKNPLLAIHCNDTLLPFSSEDEKMVWICFAKGSLVSVLSFCDTSAVNISNNDHHEKKKVKNSFESSPKNINNNTTNNSNDESPASSPTTTWKTTRVKVSSDAENDENFDDGDDEERQQEERELFRSLPQVPSRESSVAAEQKQKDDEEAPADFFDPSSEEDAKSDEKQRALSPEKNLQKILLARRNEGVKNMSVTSDGAFKQDDIINERTNFTSSDFTLEYQLELHLSNVWSLSAISPSFSSFSASSAFPFFVLGVPRGILLLSRRTWSFQNNSNNNKNTSRHRQNTTSRNTISKKTMMMSSSDSIISDDVDTYYQTTNSSAASSELITSAKDVFYPWNEAQWKQRAIFEEAGGGIAINGPWRMCPVALPALSVVGLPVVISEVTEEVVGGSGGSNNNSNIINKVSSVRNTSSSSSSSLALLRRFFAIGGSDGSVSLIRFNEKLQTASALWTVPNCHDGSISNLIVCSPFSSAVAISETVAVISSGFSDGKIKIIWSDSTNQQVPQGRTPNNNSSNNDESSHSVSTQRHITLTACAGEEESDNDISNNNNKFGSLSLSLLSCSPSMKNGNWSAVDFVSVSQYGALKWWRTHLVFKKNNNKTTTASSSNQQQQQNNMMIMMTLGDPSCAASFIDVKMMKEKKDPSSGVILANESVCGVFSYSSSSKAQPRSIRLLCTGNEKVPQLVTLFDNKEEEVEQQQQQQQKTPQRIGAEYSQNRSFTSPVSSTSNNNDNHNNNSHTMVTSPPSASIDDLMKSAQASHYHAFNSTPRKTTTTTAAHSSSFSSHQQKEEPHRHQLFGRMGMTEQPHHQQASSMNHVKRTHLENAGSVFVDPNIFSSPLPSNNNQNEQQQSSTVGAGDEFVTDPDTFDDSVENEFDDVENILLNFDRTMNPATPLSNTTKSNKATNINNNQMTSSSIFFYPASPPQQRQQGADRHHSSETMVVTPDHNRMMNKRKSSPSSTIKSSKNRISPTSSVVTPNKTMQKKMTEAKNECAIIDSSNSSSHHNQQKVIHPRPNLFHAFSSRDGNQEVRDTAKSNPNYIHRTPRHISPSGTIRAGAPLKSASTSRKHSSAKKAEENRVVNDGMGQEDPAAGMSMSASSMNNNATSKSNTNNNTINSSTTRNLSPSSSTVRSTRKAYNTVRLPNEVWNHALEILESARKEGEEDNNNSSSTPEKQSAAAARGGITEASLADEMGSDDTPYKTTRLKNNVNNSNNTSEYPADIIHSPIARLMSTKSPAKLKVNMRQGIFSSSVSPSQNRHPITLAAPPVLSASKRQQQQRELALPAKQERQAVVSSSSKSPEQSRSMTTVETKESEVESSKKLKKEEIPLSPKTKKKGGCLS